MNITIYVVFTIIQDIFFQNFWDIYSGGKNPVHQVPLPLNISSNYRYFLVQVQSILLFNMAFFFLLSHIYSIRQNTFSQR